MIAFASLLVQPVAHPCRPAAANAGPKELGFVVTAPLRDFICECTDSTQVVAWVTAIQETLGLEVGKALEIKEEGDAVVRWPPTTKGASDLFATAAAETDVSGNATAKLVPFSSEG